MTIDLSPDVEKLVRQKAKQSGLDADSFVARVLRQALGEGDGAEQSASSREEQVRQWDELMAEIDRHPLSTAPPLSDEALSRDSIYDDERHRI